MLTMIQDLLLRWVVTALFVISAAECAWAMWANRSRSAYLVSNALHLAMAVAMAVMAWPRGAALPTFGPMLFFAAATLWFVIVTFAQAGHRLANAYHAAMMLAMAWMYAVMSGGLAARPADGVERSGGHGGHHGSSMAGMPGMDMGGGAGPGEPPFVTALNWFWTVGFAVAALCWLYLLVAPSGRERRFGIACQAMMAAGMAIMFGVML